MLCPGGWLFAAGISRFASLLGGLALRVLGDPAFGEMVEEDLRSGRHFNPTGRPDYFTTAYLHRPEELRSEVEQAGLRGEVQNSRTRPTEGMIGNMRSERTFAAGVTLPETGQTERTLCFGKILAVAEMSQSGLARAMQVTTSAVTFYLAAAEYLWPC